MKLKTFIVFDLSRPFDLNAHMPVDATFYMKIAGNWAIAVQIAPVLHMPEVVPLELMRVYDSSEFFDNPDNARWQTLGGNDARWVHGGARIVDVYPVLYRCAVVNGPDEVLSNRRLESVGYFSD